MKNNTKVKLHLSKALFESLTKQVLAESKMKKEALGGYTEVKMPKAKDNRSAENATNKMRTIGEVNAQSDTQKMQKMHKMNEKMSSKEKMAKGLYKEDNLNEFLPPDALIAGAAALSMGGLTALIMKLQDILKKKDPEAYKKLQNIRGAVGAADPSKGI